ncbi:MAG: acetyl-CoA carboxylase biotin carboxyl carrier protein subunit [Rhizobiales bacterium 65-79]|mgnify:CR=1 FL=1|jgi:biotin carboxyl carrier protein|nr:MAG: acetyl-CoA carboxylase biotin carboxyl carrier protein subunit [Rhizobiales bacterium 65-79]
MARFKIESEIAGNVWKIEAKEGDHVDDEDVIMILESMKMEIPVLASESGKIVEIHVAEGDNVAENQLLVTLEN